MLSAEKLKQVVSEARMSIGSDVQYQPGNLTPNRRAVFPFESVPYALSTGDAMMILLASIIGGVTYQWSIGHPTPNLLPHCGVGLLASFVYILRFGGSGFYEFHNASKPHVEAVEIIVNWFTTALMLAFFAFLLKIGVDYSRGAFVVFAFLAPIGLLGTRKIAKSLLKRAAAQGMIGRGDVALLGEYDELSLLEPNDLLAFFGAGHVTRFVLSRDEDPFTRMSTDARVIDQVANFARENNSTEVLVSVPWTDSSRIEFIREHLRSLPISVRLLPDTRIRALTGYSSSARQNILSLEILGAPLTSLERSVKRIMDVGLAAAALLALLPVFLLTALAIKLDGPGPIIFRQERKGFNGKNFVMLKFRTMTVQENGETVTQATRHDPRVTQIGRVLRGSSIDELPQLINVLRGDMSLIGPRPHALAHETQFEKALSDYAFRRHVKPGMTGWAQCNGARGETPTLNHISERVKLDVWYINNWSLWLDVQILIKTFFEVLWKRNAF